MPNERAPIYKDQWLPGIHQPLITDEQWAAAHRGRTPGVKRGKDLLPGRVVCGFCGRRMSIVGNGKGQKHYRCNHRGEGCLQPARSNRGLLAAFVLTLRLLCDDELRQAIREDRADLRRRRSKLLAPRYHDQISADQFGEEQARLTAEIEALEADETDAAREAAWLDDLADRFEQVAALLDQLDLDDLWDAATEAERRVLVDEMLDSVKVHPDRLEVTIHGAPPLRGRLRRGGAQGVEGLYFEWCRSGVPDSGPTPHAASHGRVPRPARRRDAGRLTVGRRIAAVLARRTEGQGPLGLER